MTTVFVHGTGRSGSDNWPAQLETVADARYLTIDDWVAAPEFIAEQLVPDAVVVAHSRGAIPAVQAAVMASVPLARLVLVEPALYGIPAGPAVAAHNRRMAPLFAAAPEQDAAAFWSAFVPALTGRPARLPLDGSRLAEAERIRLAPTVWEYRPPMDLFARLRTLVVTGGWNAEYEEIAAALTAAGAEHLVLEGHEHRPNDHPDFNRATGLV